MANVTKRTVDYYTNIGLLTAQRSASNYRYYDQEALEQLRFIEKCKEDNLSLDEIKMKLSERKRDMIDIQELKEKMRGLEEDVSVVLSYLEEKGINKRDLLQNNLSHESLSLIQTLFLLLL
ncbi:MerR family transcriptional regulator [Bacillus aerolatus]|uniref:MerR family transcriptional regulator n=1 Tax=Bacillus aerolatus TaxID=2653354 RepID=A0A6I1FM18_9BACI|nr:MerR family transcriptional regulator [Bacillus aerolatus]